MSSPVTVKATTFARHFARYQEEAIREKVMVVTSHATQSAVIRGV